MCAQLDRCHDLHAAGAVWGAYHPLEVKDRLFVIERAVLARCRTRDECQAPQRLQEVDNELSTLMCQVTGGVHEGARGGCTRWTNRLMNMCLVCPVRCGVPQRAAAQPDDLLTLIKPYPARHE